MSDQNTATLLVLEREEQDIDVDFYCARCEAPIDVEDVAERITRTASLVQRMVSLPLTMSDVEELAVFMASMPMAVLERMEAREWGVDDSVTEEAVAAFQDLRAGLRMVMDQLPDGVPPIHDTDP